MDRLPMSPTAGSLLRGLIARAGTTRDRILLTDVRSTNWRSLTFSGERHELKLRVPGPDARLLVDRMCADIADAEISMPRTIVADIEVVHCDHDPDGSVSLAIEALTVAAD